MIHSVRRVEKLNLFILIVYGVFILFPLFIPDATHDHKYQLMVDFIFSMGILFFLNDRLSKEPMYQRSPFYYYVFLILVLITIWITGVTNSILYPLLFVLPVLYISINFSRKGSVGIAILSVVSLWLLFAGQRMPQKLDEVVIVSVINLSLPFLLGYIAKEHVLHMRKLMNKSKLLNRDGYHDEM